MAFVNRTERIIHIAPARPTSDLGPGQYLSATNFTKKLRPNKVPFSSTSKREDIAGRSKTPGVGRYDIDAKGKMTKFMQSQTDKYIDYNPLMFEGDSKTNRTAVNNYLSKPEGAFLSKLIRFKEKREDVDNPGPGMYIQEPEYRAQRDQRVHEELCEKKNPNFLPLAKSNCRVLSIPNKFQGYGYELVDDKVVVLNDDPDQEAKYDGVCKKIGPGKYELDKPKVWHRKGTSWSKSKVERLNPSKKKEKLSLKNVKRSLDDTESTFYKTVVEKEMSKTSTGFYDKKRQEKDMIYKHIKSKEDNFRAQVQTSKNRTLEGINRLVYKETPGPGYYFNQTFTNGFKTTIPPEYTQNFGSTCNRFETKNDKENIGPGAYFVKPKSRQRQKSTSITEAPFNSQSKRIPVFGGMNDFDFPGPGFYNPKKDPKSHKRSYSCKDVMGSSEKRFTPSKYKLKTPGPGAYDTSEDWVKLNSNEIIRMLNPQGVNSDRVIIPVQKDIKPPVGSYNPDVITNLDYKVAKNVNRMSLVSAPFNSFNKRFKEIKQDSTLGPGRYLKLNTKPIEQVYPPFKESDERFKKRTDQNPNIGPGIYNPQTNWGWNQKSYNVLYIDNNFN